MRIKSTDDENTDIMDASEALDLANERSPSTFLLENLMTATKKTKSTAADKAGASAAPAKKTKAAAKPAAKKEKGVFGPRAVPEGHTGINALAEKIGITPAVARRKLRGMENMSKPEGQHGWYWKDGSKDLAAVTKALTPAAE